MIRLNGQDIDFEKSMPLEAFLSDKGFDLARIAVELNGAIIPKTDYKSTIVENGDKIEVVSFVGGG